MASSYADDLRITKQGDNDNPNSWGDVVNVQVTELLVEAIARTAEIDVTGSANIDISTTVVNGGSDDARHAVLKLTGVIGADIDLIVPSVEKVYIVDARHTGGFTVRVIPSGGASGVDFVNGSKGIIYSEGTTITDISVEALKSSNNLSDLLSAATARTNLGLGDIAPLNAGDGLTIDGSNLTAQTAIVGEGRMWYTGSAPSLWKLCDGAAISRVTYADLFAVISTTYGVGDGSTTFNLPNFKGRSPIGAGQGETTGEGDVTGTTRTLADEGGYETHTLVESEIPSHIHPIPESHTNNFDATGGQPRDFLGVTAGDKLTSAAGGDSPHANMSPFLAVNFIIYAGV